MELTQILIQMMSKWVVESALKYRKDSLLMILDKFSRIDEVIWLQLTLYNEWKIQTTFKRKKPFFSNKWLSELVPLQVILKRTPPINISLVKERVMCSRLASMSRLLTTSWIQECLIRDTNRRQSIVSQRLLLLVRRKAREMERTSLKVEALALSVESKSTLRNERLLKLVISIAI